MTMQQICPMCMASKDTQPCRFGEEAVEIARLCRGCRMQVEKVGNFVAYRGYRIHLTAQPRLFDMPGTRYGPHGEPIEIPGSEAELRAHWLRQQDGATSAETEGMVEESEGKEGEPEAETQSEAPEGPSDEASQPKGRPQGRKRA